MLRLTALVACLCAAAALGAGFFDIPNPPRTATSCTITVTYDARDPYDAAIVTDNRNPLARCGGQNERIAIGAVVQQLLAN